MNVYFLSAQSAPNQLAARAAAKGGVCLLLLFAVCFFCVHLFRLAKIGWVSSLQDKNAPQDKQSPAQAKETEKTPAPSTPSAQPEPVYFIVERKKKRTKDSYSPPKEIRFK